NLALFTLLCVVVIAGVVAYAMHSRNRIQQTGTATPSTNSVAQLGEIRRRPHVLFRNTALGPDYGKLMAAALDAPAGARCAAAWFATKTTILHLRSNNVVAADLEEFSVRKDGQPFKLADFNFWGVTFAKHEGDRFYATLATGGKFLLVEGRVASRELTVLRE